MERKQKFIMILSFDAFCVLVIIIQWTDLTGNTNVSIPNYTFAALWFGWRVWHLKKLADGFKKSEAFEKRLDLIETHQKDIKKDLTELTSLVKSITINQSKKQENETSNGK